MTPKQWRIFRWTAWGLIVALVVFFAFFEPSEPDPLRQVEGFQELKLGGKLSKQQRTDWTKQPTGDSEFATVYAVEREWPLGRTPYPVLMELSYNARERLQQIRLTLRLEKIAPDEYEPASERARGYFSGQYAAGIIDYHQDPAHNRETIKIRGDNDNGITIAFADDILESVVFAPVED